MEVVSVALNLVKIEANWEADRLAPLLVS